MSTRRRLWRILAVLSLLLSRRASAEPPLDAASPTGGPGMQMLTIVLRHDETMTEGQIEQQLKKTGWYANFPPPDVEIVSWYVMMGIGQVVTLRFPAERLRDINVLVEREAWGAFSTEFYPTYDYRAIYADLQTQMR